MSSRFDVDSSSDSEAEQDGLSDSNQLPTEPPFMVRRVSQFCGCVSVCVHARSIDGWGSPHPLASPRPVSTTIATAIKAYLQNLKPEVAEADVRSFFHELEVVAIDLGAKGKGEGQVEFKDRETLVRWVGGVESLG